MWISGSTASLVAERRAGHREVGPRRDQPGAGRQFLAGRAQPVDQPKRQVAAGAVAADGDSRRRNALLAQEAPRGERILMRGRVGMFGRAAVVDCERAHPRRASGLRHHAPMADDRTGAVSAAVEIQQRARRFAAGDDRPFARHAVAIDRLAFHVGCHRPGRSDFVQTLPPLRPADRPRLRAQQCADGVDLAVSQGRISRGPHHRTPVIDRGGGAPSVSCADRWGKDTPRALPLVGGVASQVKAARMPGSCRS